MLDPRSRTDCRIVGEPGLLAARQTRARRRERSVRPLDRSHASNRTQIRSASPVMHRLRSRLVGGETPVSQPCQRDSRSQPARMDPGCPNTALLSLNSGPEAGPGFSADGGARSKNSSKARHRGSVRGVESDKPRVCISICKIPSISPQNGNRLSARLSRAENLLYGSKSGKRASLPRTLGRKPRVSLTLAQT